LAPVGALARTDAVWAEASAALAAAAVSEDEPADVGLDALAA
jgi:hypothetical protein